MTHLRNTKKLVYKKPSVTQLSNMLHSEKLMWWANKIGLEGTRIGTYQRKVKRKGNEYHLAVKQFLTTGEIIEGHEWIISKLVEFLDDKEIIDCEQKIETDLFQGRYDFKYRKDGEIYIVDFKSKCKKLYINQAIQLACYGMAENVTNLGVLSLLDFTYHPLSRSKLDPLKNIITDLSNLHKNLFQYEL